jgi:flavin-dependent dehydrogenase
LDLDAVIVGGGPAGAVCAQRLALHGRRVMVIERRPAGRGKACGHCLSPRALRLLESCGLGAAVVAAGGGMIRACRFHPPRGGPVTVDLRGRLERGGATIARARFDAALLDAAAAAGAAVIRCAEARIWRMSPYGAVVEISPHRGDRMRINARLVVGADGVGSRIAIAAGLAPPLRRGGGCGFAFDCDAPCDWPEPGVIEMHLSRNGYAGFVRQGERVHVGCFLRAGAGALSGRARLQSVMHGGTSGTGAIDSIGAGVTNAFGAAPLPWRPRAVATTCVALVGDAAGYTEPLTGEGLSWAVESAMLLAGIAETEGPRFWSPRAAAEYENAWRRRIRRRHVASTAIARAARLGSLIAIRRRRADPGVIEGLAQKLADRMTSPALEGAQ